MKPKAKPVVVSSDSEVEEEEESEEESSSTPKISRKFKPLPPSQRGRGRPPGDKKEEEKKEVSKSQHVEIFK